ncbi:hypothetical protein WAI453_012538 [Rhynchosporium graminicola]
MSQENDTARDIASLYDSIGGKYDIAYREILAQIASLDWLVSQLPRSGSSLLDIGCGTGCPVSLTLTISPSSHTVLGIDVLEGMLSVARSTVTSPYATFRLFDCRTFEAHPATYDAITSYFAMLLGFSQSQIRGLVGKIYVWLKPGGLLVLGTSPANVEDFEQTWLGRKGLFSSLSKDQYVALLGGLGFLIIEHRASDEVYTEGS